MTTQTISHILTQLLRERLEKRFNTTFPDLFVREVLKFFGVDRDNANYYYIGDPYDPNNPLVVEITIKCGEGIGDVKVWVWF